MNIKQFSFIISILFCFSFAYSQENDSIYQVSDIEFQSVADKSQDHLKTAKIYIDSSKISRKNHELNQSLIFLSIAEKFALELDNDSLHADLNYYYGRTYQRFDESMLSVPYFQNAIMGYTNIKDTAKLAKTYNVLGTVYKNNNLYSEAVEMFNIANKLYYFKGDSIGTAIVQLNMGNVFKNTGREDLAKNHYFKALNVFIANEDVGNEINCYNNLGNVYKNQKQYDSAFFYMYKTAALRKERNSITGLAYIYHNLANLHIATNSLDSALYYVSMSFDLKKKLNSNLEVASSYEVFGRIYMKKNFWNLAIDNFNSALKLVPDLDKNKDFVDLPKNIGQCYYNKGDFKNSAEHFFIYTSIIDSINSVQTQESIENQLIQYELFADSIETNQLLLEKELINAENENKSLSNEIDKRNLIYLVIILALIFVVLTVFLFFTRKDLNKSKKHKVVLTAQNEELKRTLISKEEKEILLKEVHHRVKNNLQIINSLIRLQSDYMNQDNFREKLKETENRVRSMALIHEKLYKSDNLSSLSVRNYIEELCINILDSYENHIKISLKFDVEECQYGIDSLIPIGLIINEAVSNSIQHAFYDQEDGVIEVSLTSTGDKTILKLSDNGIGADLTFDELKEDSLGMELIISLTDQLDGEIELLTDKGFNYIFSFPKLK